MAKEPVDQGRLPAASGNAEVEAFLRKVAAMPSVKPASAGGRLIFAMDATASREPSWDQACRIQGEMFEATAGLGRLEVQLVYYRGFRECRASRWLAGAEPLHQAMRGVRCAAGTTQIERVLAHAVKETRARKVDAVVFVGDAMEEPIDSLAAPAGELGMLGVPVFVFHEGGDATAARAFREVARLSRGAYCPFDAGSARQLKELLSAVAVYAAGGRRALADYSRRTGGATLLLSRQLDRP